MPRPLGARRHRAFACYARLDAGGVVQRCKIANNKIIFDTRKAAEQAAVAVALVDPTGDRLRVQPCWLRRGHFHLRTASKTRKAARTRTGSGVTESGQKIMAESKQEATTYECDAPKCDVEHVCVGVQEPKGLRLTAQLPYAPARAIYACKPTHIRPAVEAVLNATVPADARTDEERDADAAAAAGQPVDDEPVREEDGQDLSDTVVPLAGVGTRDSVETEDDDADELQHAGANR